MNCLLLASVALWIAILLYSPAVIYEYIKTAANPQSVTQIPRAVSLSLLGILAVFSNL
uniref:Uncharacterized protein n=1 Tax=Phakopsora pachyrhizi TaxID=170000 RepID=A0A0S1MK19_PHAPC